MPSGPGERYDFFLSRRGSVATIAQEVADVLTEKGYKVFVQDYDIPITANFDAHEPSLLSWKRRTVEAGRAEPGKQSAPVLLSEFLANERGSVGSYALGEAAPNAKSLPRLAA
jgi:hypothetical protein